MKIIFLLWALGMIAAVRVAFFLDKEKAPAVMPRLFTRQLLRREPRIRGDQPFKQEDVKQKPPEEKTAPLSVLPKSALLLPERTVKEMPIDIRTVVILRCSFYNSAARSRLKAYGSGAIISRDGHILTARHVVDMEYAHRVTGGRQGAQGYQFESCEVGEPPEGARTPAPAEIRAINPFTAINFLPYRAQIAFIPDEAGMSEAENDFIDIALLRIVGVTDDAKTFFNAALPNSFNFSALAGSAFPASGDEVVSFGFPSGAPSYGSNFYLQGSVGEVEKIISGDERFKDQPIGIAARMETIGGRSGSPVFWRGKIIGVISSKEDYTKNAAIVSVYPLLHMTAIQPP